MKEPVRKGSDQRDRKRSLNKVFQSNEKQAKGIFRGEQTKDWKGKRKYVERIWRGEEPIDERTVKAKTDVREEQKGEGKLG